MTRAQRIDLYRLLGGLLENCPRANVCQALVESRALKELGEAVGGKIGEALTRMHADVARGEDAWRAIACDYVRLFVGPRKKIAPPWESVYRSPERLVMQEPEREVLRAYAAQGVGFDGMGRQPADHIALELQFCAVLLNRGRNRQAARLAFRRFANEHLLKWVPTFATDIAKAAQTDFFRGVASTLLELCAFEQTANRQPRDSKKSANCAVESL